ncbi:secretory phospholipase A2 receptor-like isoform X1, partial [Silurus asotus]
VPHEYYLIQQKETWSDAQVYCKANYIDLAIIESDDNIIQIQNEAQRQQFNSIAWIGLYNDIKSWRWSYGNEPLGNMHDWAHGEPNNSDGRQACGAICIRGWTDRDCTEKFPSFNTTGYNYVYVSDLKTWYDARSYCRMYYTDLASTRNELEYTTVFNITYKSKASIIWIGMFRDTWKWIDQTNFSTIRWMSGKPDNYRGNENCGYLNDTQAVDAQCSDVMPFFCYSSKLKIL